MSLIKSISGIRGTIGGKVDENLTPIDAVKFAAAYGSWLKGQSSKEHVKVVIGRDARISGEMIQNLVQYTLIGLGIDVVNIGLSTTPTVEVAVPMEKADGGIILTASHNPKEWNALKLLNNKGEFVSDQDGKAILKIAQENDFSFATVDHLGKLTHDDQYIDLHIEKVLALPLVAPEAIQKKKFRVVVDAVNSTGGIAIPRLLERLGVEVVKLYCEPNGHFPHNPEPLKEHLGDICAEVVAKEADFGIVVDPDVDRLAIVCEDGEMFGEEYTLVSVADYVLSKVPGNTVSNLSSTRALRDVTLKHGGQYTAAAVGEVNVTTQMKAVNAVIGGEGNGGVIYPESHYGRDALVGIALFLSNLAHKGCKVSELRATYPNYFIAKNRIDLTPSTDVDAILERVKELYKDEQVNDIDGVKIDFADKWVHLRKSNTEPIIRVYSEAATMEDADAIGKKLMQVVYDMSK